VLNCFRNKNEIIIGNDMSLFNKNNKYNARVYELKLKYNISILSIIATKNIYSGDEIVIENKYISKLENNNDILDLVKQYIVKDEFAIITGNQIANQFGLYICNDTLSPTPRFIKYIKDTLHMNINEENNHACTFWFEKNYEKIKNDCDLFDITSQLL
jgi:hypothetical protein